MKTNYGKHGVHNDRKVGISRIIPFVIGALLLTFFAVVITLGVSSYKVYGEVQEARVVASALVVDFKTGDKDSLSNDSKELSASVSRINDVVHGPLWNIIRWLPIIGQDVSNVQTLSEIGNDACASILAPAVEQVGGMSLSGLVNGRTIDIDILRAWLSLLDESMPVIDALANKASTLQPGSIDRINTLSKTLRDSLNGVSESYGEVFPLLQNLPSMLGESGQERLYVLLAQTNSEIRASGGLIGSVGIVRICNGQIEIGDFSSVYDYANKVTAQGIYADLREDEIDAFGPELGYQLWNATLTPGFDRAGRISAQMMEGAIDGPVYGVVALDPVFLQRVLSVLGGITAADGTIVDGSNAAYELLSNAYWRYGFEENHNELEDAFFSDIAKKTVDKLFDVLGSQDFATMGRLWDVIVESGSDKRFQIWMADDAQECALSKMGLSGEIQHDRLKPEIGIYINDFSLAKICWYMDFDAQVTRVSQEAPGVWSVAATIGNSLTEQEALNAPPYISALSQPLRRGSSDMVESILIMAPLDAQISNVEAREESVYQTGQVISARTTVLYGREAAILQANIYGDSTLHISFNISLPADIVEEPLIKTSPSCAYD